MSIKTVLSRWLPYAVSERLGLVRSAIPTDAWRYWGWQRDKRILSEDAYEKVGWVYGCVRAIARNVQQVPVYAYQDIKGRGPTRSEQLPDTHPFSQLLLNPNEEDDMGAILESTATNLSLRGEALWELDGQLPGENGKPRPARIYSRPPHWLWKVEIQNDQYSAFHLRLPQLGTLIEIPGDSGVFFKYFNPRDPWRGMSPMMAAYQAADTYYAAQLFNANFFSNAATPSLALTFTKDSAFKEITQEQRDRIRSEISAFHAGIQKSHGVLVLGPGEDIKKIGADMADMDFAKLMQFEKEEILAVFGVPPIILGHVQNANRANSSDQRRMFWEETVIPIIEDIASLANRKISPRFGKGVYAKFDYSQVPAMRKDLQALGNGVIPWVTSGNLKINEARAEYLDKEPVPWGEEWWHPSNDIGTDGPYVAPVVVQPKLPGTPEDGTDATGTDAAGKITPEAARKMVGEWKNATLSRIREGASTPLAAFPPAKEAKKASRKFGVPAKMAWELAKAVHTELAIFWNTRSPEDGAAKLFDETMERIPKGRNDSGSD
jgi:HK97 family phage portal protein